MTTMKDSLPTCLLDVADRLRKLALRAPDIAHELRRFADELELEAGQARHGTEQKACRPPARRRAGTEKCEGAPGSLATLATDRGPSHPRSTPSDRDCRRCPAESCKPMSTTVAASVSRIKKKKPRWQRAGLLSADQAARAVFADKHGRE